MSKKLFVVATLLLLTVAAPALFRSTASAANVVYCSSDPGETDDVYDSSQPVDTECGSTPSSLKKYLLDAGYSASSANGIMGNLSIESCGYNLRVYNNSCSAMAPDDFVAYKNGAKTFSGGYGLAQWTSVGRVRNLQEHADNVIRQSVNTLDVQASFLVKELKSNSYKLYPSKLNAMTMEEVVWVIMRDYETPESVICTRSSSDGCLNEASARNISLSTLLEHSTQYASAYKSYSNRLTEARNAQSISTDACNPEDLSPTNPPSGGDDDDDPGTGDDSTPSTPTSTSGALGKQSSSGFYAQGNFRGVVWRRNGSDINSSGCSLIAVANAAKYLGVTPNDPSTLAGWSKGVISGESDTGWNGSVSKLINHLNLRWSGGSYLWSSYSTSTSAKISKIRQTLAAGGVVIAGGDRNKSSNPNRRSIDCTSSSNKNAGLCVFSNNGHFITIIGITSDDKLIVANAANGRNGTSSNDKINAENVLKFSNKAIGVYR